MDFYTCVQQANKRTIRDDGQVQFGASRLYTIGYTNDGTRVKEVVNYSPYLFESCKEKTGWADIFGNPVKRLEFKSISEAKKFIKGREGFVNAPPLFGMDQFAYTYIHDTFGNMKANHRFIREMILDIEVDTEGGYPDIEQADKAITAITMMYRDITFVFGYGDFVPTDPKVKYVRCKEEHELLTKFLKVWSSDLYGPDVITGWNIEGFDIPYIVRRLNRVFNDETKANELSPFGIMRERKYENFGKKLVTYVPIGISILDYLGMYKKFERSKKESYKLDYICSVEIDEKKTDYSVYGNLAGLYRNNHQMFMEYNVRDCELIRKLDDKLKYLNMIYTFAYRARVNFNDILGAVQKWDVKIHNYLLDKHIVIPFKKTDVVTGSKPAGGHVKPTRIGGYDWVVSFDLTSLYPHLIIAYNISPETKRGKLKKHISVDDILGNGLPPNVTNWLKEKDYCLAANNVYYTKEKQGFLAALMEDLFEQRKAYKKKMLEAQKLYQETKDPALLYEIAEFDNLQANAKVDLNSAYGVLANPYYRYFDRDLAESITISGQLTIRTAEKWFNTFLNEQSGTKDVDYIIASDTDSLYLDMGALVKKMAPENPVEFLDKYCDEIIQPQLAEMYENLAQQMNCFKQAMHMKRESINDRGVFVAKKRYILHMHDNEGVRYDPPKVKMTGIEAVRSTTPAACRDAIKGCLMTILKGTEPEVQKYIREYKKEFMQLPIEDIAYPTGVNGIGKYSDPVHVVKPKTPAHVRGAIVYNMNLKKKGLEGKFPPIYDKDKIKWVPLRMPNPLLQPSLAFSSELPKEFGVEKYVDKAAAFEKNFLSPLTKIINVLGWEPVKVFRMTEFSNYKDKNLEPLADEIETAPPEEDYGKTEIAVDQDQWQEDEAPF